MMGVVLYRFHPESVWDFAAIIVWMVSFPVAWSAGFPFLRLPFCFWSWLRSHQLCHIWMEPCLVCLEPDSSCLGEFIKVNWRQQASSVWALRAERPSRSHPCVAYGSLQTRLRCPALPAAMSKGYHVDRVSVISLWRKAGQQMCSDVIFHSILKGTSVQGSWKRLSGGCALCSRSGVNLTPVLMKE